MNKVELRVRKMLWRKKKKPQEVTDKGEWHMSKEEILKVRRMKVEYEEIKSDQLSINFK